jgi:hypothetical protein
LEDNDVEIDIQANINRDLSEVSVIELDLNQQRQVKYPTISSDAQNIQRQIHSKGEKSDPKVTPKMRSRSANLFQKSIDRKPH